MTFDPAQFVNPLLLGVKPYQPGKPIKECQRELGLTDFIKLASNENPLGTSAQVTSQLAAEFSQLALYPDGATYDLKTALSQFLKLSPSQIIIGNGSEDVLKMAIQTFVWGNNQLIISEYAFVAYKILAQGLGVDVKEVKAKNFGIDLEAILNAVGPKTRMIMFANPNNPTGTYVNHKNFVAFMDKLSADIFVVCDEAYFEYMLEKDYPQTVALLKQYPNLIITRTFSKVYGMAGLRIGYGLADERIIELMNRVRQPFNANHLGQVAAVLALRDQDFVKKSILVNEQGKQQLMQGFTKLGLKFLPSHANFFSVEINLAGTDVFQALLKQGIIVRPLAPYRMEHYYRITIGTTEQNEACLRALQTILQKEKVV